MGQIRFAALAAWLRSIVLAVAVAAVQCVANAQSCAAAGSPGGMFGGGLAAAVLGGAPSAVSATFGSSLLADPALRPLVEAPASCAPAEPASRESSVPSVAAGNPVDLVTGAKYERAIDLHLPVGSPGGTDSFDFVFARHYSSALHDSSVLGPGWRHSFQTRLLVESGRRGLLPFVLQADGRRVSFTRRYRLAGGGVRRHAARHDDGVLDERPGAADGTWVWRWRNGRQVVFDAGGRLVRIVTSDRDAIALRYDHHGRLAVVADNRGHRLDLRYYAEGDPAAADLARKSARAHSGGAFAGRLAALALPTGSEVAYRYDSEGRLTRVDHLDGKQVRYRYEDPRSPAHLTAVTLPGGARSEYRYDEQGRVAYSRAAGAGEPDALRFTYSPAQDRAQTGSTLVGWGAGESMHATYRWRIGADGVPMLESGVGAACVTCPPVERKYGWSRAGDLASIEFGGARLEFVRDEQGRLRTAWLRKPPAARRDLLAEIVWREDPVLDLAALVRRPSVVPGHWHDLAVRYGARGQPVSIEEAGYSPLRLDASGRIPASPAEPISRSVRLSYEESGPARGKLAGVRGPGVNAAWSIRHVAPGAAVPRDLPVVGAAMPRETAAARAWVESATTRSAGLAATAAMALEAGVADVRREPRAGLLTVTTPGGRMVRYAFDDFDRTAIVQSPDSGTLRRRHDDAGRIVEEEQEGVGRARQRYDARGRLLEHVLASPSGEAVATRYRYRGDFLVAIEHPDQSEAFEYDRNGRLALRTVFIHRTRGAPLVVRTHYRYDASTGLLLERSLVGGAVLKYRRDAQGQVTGLLRGRGGHGARTLVAGLVRTSAGLARIRYGNAVQGFVDRDPFGLGARIRYLSAGSSGNRGVLADHALRFDVRGNPVRWSNDGKARWLRYDAAGRLVQVAQSGGAKAPTWRYGWEPDGTRLLAQEAVRPLGGDQTTRVSLLQGSHRVGSERGAAGGARPFRYDAIGRLVDDGRRQYRWSPSGQLLQVGESGRVIARYRYNHRGERIAKEIGGRTTYFVHENRQLVAELDRTGRIVREYVWLADLPVAVLDPAGAAPARVVFLHPNHLGAPGLASDEAGRVVWRADYAPFGRASVLESAFRLALRLPGQYHDDETGLHYNDHRYYDPDRGRYLSPDPIGLRGGLDPYAYAGGNPVRYVDATGLLLFAFDGTGNSDPPPRLDDWSNVYKLARAYAGGRVWYMSGIGTNDVASGIAGAQIDAVLASSARSRVDWMLQQLDRTAAAATSRGRLLQVDVIGFSRGAAIARDFANRVADLEHNGHFGALGSCVRLRFLGLWDTVAQFGLDGIANLAWKLSIPAEVAFAAQAVALNEHRALFPGESILGGPAAGPRIERGFVGAHADIGGSYAEGDLSDVALVWMREQALAAGVPMFALTSEFQRVTDPWLHDSSAHGLGDREFSYRNSLGLVAANPFQRVAPVGGLQWSGTSQFITRLPVPHADAYGEPTLVGRVNMDSYSQWLRQNYSIRVAGP